MKSTKNTSKWPQITDNAPHTHFIWISGHDWQQKHRNSRNQKNLPFCLTVYSAFTSSTTFTSGWSKGKNHGDTNFGQVGPPTLEVDLRIKKCSILIFRADSCGKHVYSALGYDFWHTRDQNPAGLQTKPFLKICIPGPKIAVFSSFFDFGQVGPPTLKVGLGHFFVVFFDFSSRKRKKTRGSVLGGVFLVVRHQNPPGLQAKPFFQY